MKVTVSFLKEKNNKINNILSNLTEKFKVYSFVIFLVIALCFIARHIKISKDILKFATNFRQADGKNVELKDIIDVFAIYNEDNYIFSKDKKVEENIVVVNDISEEEKIIDTMADNKTSEAVFSKKVSANITEETKTLQRISIDTMRILNYSSKRNINFEELLNGNVNLTKKSDKILLYNTHTSESYSNSDNYKFDYTGNKRTTDANYNMLAIAKECEKNLTSKGFIAIQNTTPHDYGTYTSAYAKSRITVKDALPKIGGVGISVDLHRDATSDLEFRPVVNINGVQVAQCMLVMGVGTDTDVNEFWNDNLKLAIKMQQIADEVYPGLFRPMYIRNSIYNQDLNKYSLLIEVGASGNTIEEAKLATRCLANLFNIIYKD